MKWQDINQLAIGNTSQLAGVIYTGEPNCVFLLPGEEMPIDVKFIEMTDGDWKEFFNQTDNQITQVNIGHTKSLIRKCQRVIDQNISWEVYERDGYKCRYCDRGGIPLTVDHIDLWENGGATVVENLITSCKRCNKTRGNMPYDQWMTSIAYKNFSAILDIEQKEENLAIVSILPYLETLRVKTIKSR